MLGVGVYTPQQAARYARLRTQTLNRWIHGNATGDSAVRAQLSDDPDRFVTFLDLVQAMAIRAIRLEDKVPLQRIRQVVQIASDRFNVDYPFATRHTTYLFNDDIVIRLRDETLVQITGKYKNHQLINQVVEVYAEDLVYDNVSKLARKYVAYRYKDREVVLDPLVRFGEPIVSPSGMSAESLVAAVRSEGTIENAMEVFGVDRNDIIAAQRYFDWLQGIAA